MKKILITGANSYIGTSFEQWLEQWPNMYTVDTIDMRDDNWKEKVFSQYDVVFHVAGIAHIKEKKENRDIYYRVNRDLAYEVTKKAKSEGVKQYVFLSSMSVYGMNTGIITKDITPAPKSNYGKSKLQAEELIMPLEDDCFKISIVRPPMVYGKGCKGNYAKLAKSAISIPAFPDINNKRSMIFIDFLCDFIKQLIDDQSRGLFFPQNDEYVCTSEMVSLIAEAHGKKLFMTKLFNPLLHLLKIDIVQKIFGDLVYEKSMSDYSDRHQVYNLEMTIRLTEK
ncbi:MAG: NAD-dependent epimerase [Herbinix sp.]|jgi:UDP-glucose 4-epimerase|nr:NAD-dependent epimerase [Herbinix sp.]